MSISSTLRLIAGKKSVLAGLLLVAIQSGCNHVPMWQYRSSQAQARQLYGYNKTLADERDQAQWMASSAIQEKQQAEQALASLHSELDIANKRLANLQTERSELHDRYKTLLTNARNGQSPLSNDATRRFQALAEKYPEFEFDPNTGISKFHSDILFASGSDAIKSSATPLLREFSNIMNDGEARRLNILVVGHTDDKAIRKDRTKQAHPTNWHLSTNRANSVVLQLSKLGLNDARMGAAGYSKHQPVVPNVNEPARQRNRRVEIFVLAPDAVVAGWDPATSR